MAIGYACLALAVPGTGLRGAVLRNAGEARLREIIAHNLAALERMAQYNAKNGIRLFRISSDVIPFASSPVNAVPWEREFAEQLHAIWRTFRAAGIRVSMHPGQYTVLNSPDPETVRNSMLELDYHARFLEALGADGTNKIILHIGGAYGDREAAMRRFGAAYDTLPERVKARLVIENDDRIFHIGDALAVGLRKGIPVVFDNLHHMANPPPQGGGDDARWISECAATWGPRDGRQKIHYSQPDEGKRLGAHSRGIAADPFLAFWDALPVPRPDVMLEVKDKNVSARKCILLTDPGMGIGALETEWGRWKYLVLERSQAAYLEARRLLKDKSAYPALAFYRAVERALASPVTMGGAVNAAQHVWGYFKDAATPARKKAFAQKLEAVTKPGGLPALKRFLYRLAEEHSEGYLLESYYFAPQYAADAEAPAGDATA
ncbi:MAG TPA: UV DNA damage repair endonuclease UvsE [Candidatus Limnocylindria bacterium]|nr:UV DNA damage repair endonuclease UvsE [Candidatus Limnocylindria bacterium]